MKYFYRLEIKANLNWKLNSFIDEWKYLYFECEYIPSSEMFNNQFCYKYMLYPQNWIKYENAKQDGFVTYANKYYTPEKILHDMCENYKGTLINPYTNELIYQH